MDSQDADRALDSPGKNVKSDVVDDRLAESPVALREGASSAPLRLATLWEMGRDTLRILWWSLRER